jgi:hypothetical protein
MRLLGGKFGHLDLRARVETALVVLNVIGC